MMRQRNRDPRDTDMHTLPTPRFWLAARLLAVQHTLRVVLFGTDTRTIRFILSCASFVAAISLLWNQDLFDKQAYEVVRVFGNEVMWAGYFLVHWAGAVWRIFEATKSRPRWAFAVNVLGLAVWFISISGLAWAVGSVGIPTSLGFTVCALAAWALWRTGFGEEAVTS